MVTPPALASRPPLPRVKVTPELMVSVTPPAKTSELIAVFCETVALAVSRTFSVPAPPPLGRLVE